MSKQPKRVAPGGTGKPPEELCRVLAKRGLIHSSVAAGMVGMTVEGLAKASRKKDAPWRSERHGRFLFVHEAQFRAHWNLTAADAARVQGQVTT